MTEAEVWSNVTDLADKANAAAGLTSALDAALRECLVEAVSSVKLGLDLTEIWA